MKGRQSLLAFLLAVGLCFVSVFQVSAQKAETQGCGEFKWGMSPEEVKEISSDYENMTGEKIWEEEIHTDRFCVLKTNDFDISIAESWFSPEITLRFFDNKLFDIFIFQEESLHRLIWIEEIEDLSILAEKLIDKYGTPSFLGSFLDWQGRIRKPLAELKQFISPFDSLGKEREENYLKQLHAGDGFTLLWEEEERKNELRFYVSHWTLPPDEDSSDEPLLFLVPRWTFKIRLIIKYTNGLLKSEYEQEKQKAGDKLEVNLEAF